MILHGFQDSIKFLSRRKMEDNFAASLGTFDLNPCRPAAGELLRDGLKPLSNRGQGLLRFSLHRGVSIPLSFKGFYQRLGVPHAESAFDDLSTSAQPEVIILQT